MELSLYEQYPQSEIKTENTRLREAISETELTIENTIDAAVVKEQLEKAKVRIEGIKQIVQWKGRKTNGCLAGR